MRKTLALCIALVACNDSFDGTVDRIIDGDTFIMSGARIRLWGIQAPEMKEPYGPYAKGALALLIAQDARLRCEIMDNDRYKRIVAKCANAYGDLGAALVAAGHAYDWSRYSGGAYRQEENSARTVRAGLWGAQ